MDIRLIYDAMNKVPRHHYSIRSVAASGMAHQSQTCSSTFQSLLHRPRAFAGSQQLCIRARGRAGWVDNDLIIGDGTDSLLAHGALVRVPRGLVVVGVGDHLG